MERRNGVHREGSDDYRVNTDTGTLMNNTKEGLEAKALNTVFSQVQHESTQFTINSSYISLIYI